MNIPSTVKGTAGPGRVYFKLSMCSRQALPSESAWLSRDLLFLIKLLCHELFQSFRGARAEPGLSCYRVGSILTQLFHDVIRINQRTLVICRRQERQVGWQVTYTGYLQSSPLQLCISLQNHHPSPIFGSRRSCQERGYVGGGREIN